MPLMTEVLLSCRWARPVHESVGFGQNTETKSNVKTSGGQSDVLQIVQGRRTSGGESPQMFRPLTQQLATDGSVQPPTSICGVAHKKGTVGFSETLIIIE